MQMQPQQRQGQTGVIWLMIALRSLAVPLDVILHRGFGTRYWDLRTGSAAVLIWFAPTLFPTSDPRPAWCFLVLYLFMNVRARVEAHWMAKRGYVVHSHYSGVPLLCRWRPNWNEQAVKRFVEPGFALLAGWIAARWFNQPLGLLFAGCGFSAFFDASHSSTVQKRRELDLRDAMLDAQSIRACAVESFPSPFLKGVYDER